MVLSLTFTPKRGGTRAACLPHLDRSRSEPRTLSASQRGMERVGRDKITAATSHFSPSFLVELSGKARHYLHVTNSEQGCGFSQGMSIWESCGHTVFPRAASLDRGRAPSMPSKGKKVRTPPCTGFRNVLRIGAQVRCTRELAGILDMRDGPGCRHDHTCLRGACGDQLWGAKVPQGNPTTLLPWPPPCTLPHPEPG